jgi:hypothetical protein
MKAIMRGEGMTEDDKYSSKRDFQDCRTYYNEDGIVVAAIRWDFPAMVVNLTVAGIEDHTLIPVTVSRQIKVKEINDIVKALSSARDYIKEKKDELTKDTKAIMPEWER